MVKMVNPRTLETSLRTTGKERGYHSDYLPCSVIAEVVGLKEKSVWRRLKDNNVPRIGSRKGTRYYVPRVADAFTKG